MAGMGAIDDAIAALSTRRVDLGAAQNRLGASLSNLGTQSVNLEEARSRIEDADIAQEVSNMVAAQIREKIAGPPRLELVGTSTEDGSEASYAWETSATSVTARCASSRASACVCVSPASS